VSSTVVRGSIYQIYIGGEYNIYFRCSYRLIPLPLATIGTIIGLEKFDVDLSLTGIPTESKTEYIDYCVRDSEIVKLVVEIAYSILHKLVKLENYLTLSGVAVGIFLGNFNDLNIKLNLNRDMDKYIRKAYYGGRTEVFGNVLADESILYYDFPGMYSNMLLGEFPIGSGVLNITNSVFEGIGFFAVDIYSPREINIPVLPFRKDKLLFPNGFYSGVY
jgi:hypothetical protein